MNKSRKRRLITSNTYKFSSVAPIIGSLINKLPILAYFLFIGIGTLSMVVADYLLIKFFGGLLVVKKPYLIQTLRLTL